jgi:hypothetical protein
MQYQIRFKDIDPDSGKVSQEVTIATCETENLATWVKESIERDWYKIDGSCDPNREFYIKPVSNKDKSIF